MLEISESILRSGYTITIIKEKGKERFRGLYSKNMSSGLHAYELPEEELRILPHLSNINELLNEGEILQVSMPGLSYESLIGREKTEEPYSGRKYLEVHGKAQSFGYCDCLINLNEQLGAKKWQRVSNAPQYEKTYRGENKYE